MSESAAAEASVPSEWRPPARYRWSTDDARAMARALAESGETHAAFAKRHGLSEERIRLWLRRLGEPPGRPGKREPAAFVPLRVVQSQRHGVVEIQVGTRVVRVSSGFCKDTLLEVLAALESSAC